MKSVIFAMMDVAKTAEVVRADDKVWANPPPGTKFLVSYACQGLAFPGVPPNTVVSIRVVEAESNEAIAAIMWPISVAGASVWNVPVLELPTVGVAELEERLRG